VYFRGLLWGMLWGGGGGGVAGVLCNCLQEISITSGLNSSAAPKNTTKTFACFIIASIFLYMNSLYNFMIPYFSGECNEGF